MGPQVGPRWGSQPLPWPLLLPQVLGSVKNKIEAFAATQEDFPVLLFKAKKYLIGRLEGTEGSGTGTPPRRSETPGEDTGWGCGVGDMGWGYVMGTWERDMGGDSGWGQGMGTLRGHGMRIRDGDTDGTWCGNMGWGCGMGDMGWGNVGWRDMRWGHVEGI